MKYPEHTRLRALKGDNQKIGDFLTWLGEQGVILCKNEQEPDFEAIQDQEEQARARRQWDRRDPELQPWYQPTEKILALYFEIDMDKLEREKVAMLDELRASHGDHG